MSLYLMNLASTGRLIKIIKHYFLWCANLISNSNFLVLFTK